MIYNIKYALNFSVYIQFHIDGTSYRTATNWHPYTFSKCLHIFFSSGVKQWTTDAKLAP